MDIQQDIQDAIAKQLPAQVGEVLRVRLEQAEKDAALVKSQKARIDELLRDTQRASNMIDARDAQLKRAGDLDARSADLDTRERNIKLTLLEGQLAAETSKTAFAKEVALGLVRNVEYRHSVFENSNKQVPTMPGAYTMSQSESSNKTDTSTAA
jgi:hypothetical protein